MSGSTNVVAIDIGEAVGEVRETVRCQLSTVRLVGNTLGGAGVGLTVVEILSALAVPESEVERLLENIARNVVQALLSLEVEG